jgi:hypothetical protein
MLRQEEGVNILVWLVVNESGWDFDDSASEATFELLDFKLSSFELFILVLSGSFELLNLKLGIFKWSSLELSGKRHSGYHPVFLEMVQTFSQSTFGVRPW